MKERIYIQDIVEDIQEEAEKQIAEERKRAEAAERRVKELETELATMRS